MIWLMTRHSNMEKQLSRQSKRRNATQVPPVVTVASTATPKKVVPPVVKAECVVGRRTSRDVYAWRGALVAVIVICIGYACAYAMYAHYYG